MHLTTDHGLPSPIDCATRDGEIQRRNVLFGLWAGQRIGLRDDALERYALSVLIADQALPGHDDVIAKVAADLAAAGKPMHDRQLRDRLYEMTIRAGLDLDPGATLGAARRRSRRMARRRWAAAQRAS